MLKLPAKLLDRPAPEGARRLAVLRLRALERARPRLDDPADPDALHDFRVALRRLRSVLRAYRGVLGDTVSPKTRRLLSQLARETGACRDGEVRLEWLESRRGAIEGVDDAVFEWAEGRIRRAKAGNDRKLRRELERNFGTLTARLGHALTHYHVSLATGARRRVPRTRDLLGGAIAELTASLREKLAVPTGVADVRELHRARIAGKKLRYVLEPVADGGFAPVRLARASRTAVRQLSLLQDQLGLVNDSHEFGEWLHACVARTSSPAANPGTRIDGLLLRLAVDADAGYAAATLPENRQRLDAALAAVEAAVRAMMTRTSTRTTLRT